MSPQPALQKQHNPSTGPRTAAGKAISSKNSFRHGLASGMLLIPGEDATEWELLLNGLIAEWTPASLTERLLVENMAKHHWLVERALRLQCEALAAAGPGTLPASLALLLRYQTTNERAFVRAQKSLEDMQKARRQFVSQNQRQAADTSRHQALARLTAPLPTPDYDDIIRRLREARQPLPSVAHPSPTP